MNNTTKVLTAFAAGAVIGTAYGILTAPNSGSRTRRKIRRKGEKIVSDVQDIVSEVQDKISEGKERLVDLKEDFVKAVKGKVEMFS